MWLVLPLALLPGCVGDTNPETAGLFDNISNLNSGEYDRQIESRRAALASLEQSNQATQQRVGALEAQRSANASQLADLRRQISAAKAEAKQLRSKLAGNPQGLSRLMAIESQIENIDAAARSGQDPAVLSGEMIQVRRSLQALRN